MLDFWLLSLNWRIWQHWALIPAWTRVGVEEMYPVNRCEGGPTLLFSSLSTTPPLSNSLYSILFPTQLLQASALCLPCRPRQLGGRRSPRDSIKAKCYWSTWRGRFPA